KVHVVVGVEIALHHVGHSLGLDRSQNLALTRDTESQPVLPVFTAELFVGLSHPMPPASRQMTRTVRADTSNIAANAPLSSTGPGVTRTEYASGTVSMIGRLVLVGVNARRIASRASIVVS